MSHEFSPHGQFLSVERIKLQNLPISTSSWQSLTSNPLLLNLRHVAGHIARELVWHQHLSSSIWKKFTCHQTLVYYLMDSFSLHILVQLLYNLHLHDVEIQNITLPQPELNDPINSHYFDQVIHYKEQWSHQFGCLVPGMFIFITSSKHNVSDINTSDHYDLILCSACRTCICIWLLMEMWTYTRAVTVTKEYWYHLRL